MLIGIGRILYGLHIPSGTLPAFVLGVFVVAARFCCLSFAAASFIRNEDSAEPIIQAIVLPLYFISGVFVPKDQLSSPLRAIASLFPISHLNNIFFKAFNPRHQGRRTVAHDLLILGIWGIGGVVVGLWRFSWSPLAAD